MGTFIPITGIYFDLSGKERSKLGLKGRSHSGSLFPVAFCYRAGFIWLAGPSPLSGKVKAGTWSQKLKQRPPGSTACLPVQGPFLSSPGPPFQGSHSGNRARRSRKPEDPGRAVSSRAARCVVYSLEIVTGLMLSAILWVYLSFDRKLW